MVDQKDADLATVPGVDQPRAVHDPDSMTTGMTRTWQNESGISHRDGDSDAGGHGHPFSRFEDDVDAGVKVDCCIADMSMRWNGQFPIEKYEVNLHGVQGHRAG